MSLRAALLAIFVASFGAATRAVCSSPRVGIEFLGNSVFLRADVAKEPWVQLQLQHSSDGQEWANSGPRRFIADGSDVLFRDGIPPLGQRLYRVVSSDTYDLDIAANLYPGKRWKYRLTGKIDGVGREQDVLVEVDTGVFQGNPTLVVRESSLQDQTILNETYFAADLENGLIELAARVNGELVGGTTPLVAFPSRFRPGESWRSRQIVSFQIGLPDFPPTVNIELDTVTTARLERGPIAVRPATFEMSLCRAYMDLAL